MNSLNLTESESRWGRRIIAVIALYWYMNTLNMVGENSYETYLRKEYGIQQIYREDDSVYYKISGVGDFSRMSYTGTHYGVLNFDETDFYDEADYHVTYKFVKVFGVNIDLTDHKANYRVAEEKLSDERKREGLE